MSRAGMARASRLWPRSSGPRPGSIVPAGLPCDTTCPAPPPRTAEHRRAPIRSRYDAGMRVTVVGAGVMGAWAALWLRRGGHDVTLVDRHGPGNHRGSSGDE